MADPLDSLRSLMAAHSPPLHAIIVPSQDNHQSEYISDRDKRRQFISGFTGNANLALITMSEALLWIDVCCFLQATQELNDRWKPMCIGEDPTVETWITDNLPSEAIVGIDPWCVSDRSAVEVSPVVVHPLEYAGRGVQDKLKDLREKLLHESAYGIIFSSLDEISWLCNIRGNDVSYCPVVQSYAIVTMDSAFFYVDKRKVSSEFLLLKVAKLDAQKSSDDAEKQLKSDKIWVDPSSCCLALFGKLSANQVFWQQSPLALAKALKNPVELNGLRKA
ncbi:hypothetical protein LUZ63_006026 [Rhynchospora breviuscula]|uniref:Creatinase N-terminal domain-containing protein n=1 Tax=Rhynchospora breviuscula TaxID=2022672 RepID=A0A9Q0HT53_9POAL|nr:hypothetical protein LUZ63_006026 [Rhynchospora breviuscula]